MRKACLFGLLLLRCSCASAQEFNISAAYAYLYADQWDKAIQTYNFSRPFLKEKQALLASGLNTSLSYIFKNEKHLKHGIGLSYSYFGSAAENENFNTKLQLHFVKLAYVLHYEQTKNQKGLYADFLISAVSSGLFRKVNGEPFVYDETNSKAFGLGGELQLNIGYYLKLKNKQHLSPFIGFGYTPYFYSPNSESVINQTKNLTSSNSISMFITQIGLRYHRK